MSNKRFNPFIILSGLNPGDDETPGDGTGQGGQEPWDGLNSNSAVSGPMSFSNWQSIAAGDNNGDGAVDFADYCQWWADSGFSMDAWSDYNPGSVFSFSPSSES